VPLATPAGAVTDLALGKAASAEQLPQYFRPGLSVADYGDSLHKLSDTLYNSLRFCPFNGDCTSGPVGAFFADDHTHFEAAGARQIAGLVTTAVRDQRLGLSAYLR
jgi:hypothetical protein